MYWIYIISNERRTVFYTGVTNNIGRRLCEHRNKKYKGFSAKYNCHVLLYFEEIDNGEKAMKRELQVKRYKRDWKENLINSINPEWKDLTEMFPNE